MIRYVLEQHEFSVTEASHAQDARRLLSAEKIDLILMDWMLPGRSGLDLTRELKAGEKSSTPFDCTFIISTKAQTWTLRLRADGSIEIPERGLAGVLDATSQSEIIGP